MSAAEKTLSFSIPFHLEPTKRGAKKKSSIEKIPPPGELPLHDRPAAVDVPQGCDFSIPYIIDHSTVTPVLRLRTEEDDLVDAVCQCDTFPTKRAIRMANAIMLERLLVTGKYGSATNMARLIGVSQPHVTQLLNMLNLPPAEIEAILFETV